MSVLGNFVHVDKLPARKQVLMQTEISESEFLISTFASVKSSMSVS